MDLDSIEQLLVKYWECRTTVEEEKVLKTFFNRDAVPEKWRAIAPLFQYYKEELHIDHLDGLFDEQVLARIEALKGSSAPGKKQGKVVRMFYDIAKVAAVGLILATAAFFVREEYINKEDEMGPYLADTFEDPRVAFEETKKALMVISKNFNKGRKEAQKVGALHEAREKIKETAVENNKK